MCLLAQGTTWFSWLGVYCLLMERFHSWSRCVYNYTLGNRILSVYKGRMFWQALRFFENSLRKQLWLPSAELPLATVRTLGHQHPVPGPSGYWLWPSSQRWLIGLHHQPILESTSAPVVRAPHPQPFTSVCLWKLSSIPELPQKFNESSCWLKPWVLNVLGKVLGRPGLSVSSLVKSYHPFMIKARWACQHRGAANKLGKKKKSLRPSASVAGLWGGG